MKTAVNKIKTTAAATVFALSTNAALATGSHHDRGSNVYEYKKL